jgi:hypothetical protein
VRAKKVIVVSSPSQGNEDKEVEGVMAANKPKSLLITLRLDPSEHTDPRVRLHWQIHFSRVPQLVVERYLVDSSSHPREGVAEVATRARRKEEEVVVAAAAANG